MAAIRKRSDRTNGEFSNRATHNLTSKDICPTTTVVPPTHFISGQRHSLATNTLQKLLNDFNNKSWLTTATKIKEHMPRIKVLCENNLIRFSLVELLNKSIQSRHSRNAIRILDLIEHDCLSKIYRSYKRLADQSVAPIFQTFPDLKTAFDKYTGCGKFNLIFNEHSHHELIFGSTDCFAHLFCNLEDLEGTPELNTLRKAAFTLTNYGINHADGSMPHHHFEWTNQFDLWHSPTSHTLTPKKLLSTVQSYNQSISLETVSNIYQLLSEDEHIYEHFKEQVFYRVSCDNESITSWEESIKHGDLESVDSEISNLACSILEDVYAQLKYKELFYDKEMTNPEDVIDKIRPISHPMAKVLLRVAECFVKTPPIHNAPIILADECVANTAYCICPVSDTTPLGNHINEQHDEFYQHMMSAGEYSEHYEIDITNPTFKDAIKQRMLYNTLVWVIGTASCELVTTIKSLELAAAA